MIRIQKYLPGSCFGKPSCCGVQERLVCGKEALQAYPVHAYGWKERWVSSWRALQDHAVFPKFSFRWGLSKAFPRPCWCDKAQCHQSPCNLSAGFCPSRGVYPMVLMSGASTGKCHCPQTEARSWPRVGGVRQHVMLGFLFVPKATNTLRKEESVGQSKGPPRNLCSLLQ